MKHHLFPLILLLLCSTTLKAQELDQERLDFANKFVAEVQAHNSKKILKCLDKTYRKEQTEFLGGNTQQLLNELFSGEDGKQYVTIPMDAILKIEIAEVTEKGPNSYGYIFKVSDGRHEIFAWLELKKVKNKWGFVGAVG